MNKPTICCQACKGTGRTWLPEGLFKTLQLFPSRKVEHSAPDLAASEKVSSNVMNNRLEALRKLGFLTRYRQATRYIYLRTKGEPVPLPPKKKAPKTAKAAAK